ncbi:hypothetical protein AAY473_032402 [Plecturocebus cupreus]
MTMSHSVCWIAHTRQKNLIVGLLSLSIGTTRKLLIEDGRYQKCSVKEHLITSPVLRHRREDRISGPAYTARSPIRGSAIPAVSFPSTLTTAKVLLESPCPGVEQGCRTAERVGLIQVSIPNPASQLGILCCTLSPEEKWGGCATLCEGLSEQTGVLQKHHGCLRRVRKWNHCGGLVSDLAKI